MMIDDDDDGNLALLSAGCSRQVDVVTQHSEYTRTANLAAFIAALVLQ